MPQGTSLNMRNLLNRNMFSVNDNQAKGLGEAIFQEARAVLNGKRRLD